MIGRLKDLLARRDDSAAPDARIRLAAAALLVEAAQLDGHMDEAEQARIRAVLAGHFGLGADETARLVAEAREAVEQSVELHGFTKVVKDNFDADQRVRMIEMLWEVAFADGQLHDYEANLVRRVAGLLYVPDQESGAARKRALARLGLKDGLA